MRLILILSLITVFTVGCASKTKKEINQEMAKTEVFKNEKELIKEESTLANKNPVLSEDKRHRLTVLLENAQKENQVIDTDILKTKTILFKELMAEGNNWTKINILENQIVKLNRKKTRNTLNAYREAKNVVGKNPPVPLDESLMEVERSMLHAY
jgi:hypothetical protein